MNEKPVSCETVYIDKLNIKTRVVFTFYIIKNGYYG